MATQLQSMPDNSLMPGIDASRVGRIAVVVSQWNRQITAAIETGAVETLKEAGLTEDQIEVIYVPGAFELTYTAALLDKAGIYDAIILLGCVIRGETSHYDLICDSVAQAATELNLRASQPVIFGLVTTENLDQALARAGGALGNKGSECATVAMQMIFIRKQYGIRD